MNRLVDQRFNKEYPLLFIESLFVVLSFNPIIYIGKVVLWLLGGVRSQKWVVIEFVTTNVTLYYR